MSSSTTSVPSPAPSRLPKLDLSATQVISTGFAGVTATFLASYLGVSGTIIGAAVVSMATAIGNAVYGQSLRSTRDKVREVVPIGKADPASPTIVLPAQTDDVDATATDDEPPTLPTAVPDAVAGVPDAVAAMPARAWKRVAFVAVAMFAGLLAIVTSVEVFAGRPLSDVVRGEAGHGTSLGGGGSNNQQQVPASTTMTVTVTPKVVVTTPTVTQTAPPKTTTTTPGSTTGGTTSGSTSSTGSGSATSTTPGTPSSSTLGRP